MIRVTKDGDRARCLKCEGIGFYDGPESSHTRCDKCWGTGQLQTALPIEEVCTNIDDFMRGKTIMPSAAFVVLDAYFRWKDAE
jgi:hypothetical protein